MPSTWPATATRPTSPACSAVLDAIDGEVVLLGHSYGGAVITDAGVHPSVRHLVYLSAFALDHGETCASAATGAPGIDRISHAGRPNLGHTMIPHDDGTSTLTRDGAHACLYADVDDDTFDWAFAGSGPSATTRSAPHRARRVAGEAVDLRRVHRGPGVHPDLQRILACRCTTTIEWPIGHSPFVNRPELVADLVVDLARRSG